MNHSIGRSPRLQSLFAYVASGLGKERNKRMDKSLIPILAEAIEQYVPKTELGEIGEMFSVEVLLEYDERGEARAKYLKLAYALVATPARISTLVSVLLTIGWPRTPLLMRVEKHSRR